MADKLPQSGKESFREKVTKPKEQDNYYKNKPAWGSGWRLKDKSRREKEVTAFPVRAQKGAKTHRTLGWDKGVGGGEGQGF